MESQRSIQLKQQKYLGVYIDDDINFKTYITLNYPVLWEFSTKSNNMSPKNICFYIMPSSNPTYCVA